MKSITLICAAFFYATSAMAEPRITLLPELVPGGAFVNPALTIPPELIGQHHGAMGQWGQSTKDGALCFGGDDVTLGGIELRADGELIVPFALRGEAIKNLSFTLHEVGITGGIVVWKPLEVGKDRYSATLFRYGSVFRILVKLHREDESIVAMQWVCAEPREAEQGADQPATAPESKPQDKEKAKPESEVRPQ